MISSTEYGVRASALQDAIGLADFLMKVTHERSGESVSPYNSSASIELVL